jgi:probable rRNA maturation factor
LTRPDPPTVTLNVPEGWSVPEPLLERAVRVVLEKEGITRGEFSVTFLPDSEARALNLRWLKHDWVPDVLSFALHEAGEAPLGDVYVGIEQAQRQARTHGIALDEELVRLAVHGTLHVLGHEHEPEEAVRAEGELYRLQEAVVGEVLARAPGSRPEDREPDGPRGPESR